LPRRLADSSTEPIGFGDLLRLSANYDLGPGSAPVDLLVCELNEPGPGLIVASGQKAGLVFAVLPEEACDGGRSLSAAWLRENWERWFRFTYLDEPLPIADALVIRWDERRLPETV
jgi:hypothetical protein